MSTPAWGHETEDYYPSQLRGNSIIEYNKENTIFSPQPDRRLTVMLHRALGITF
jgi:hypothetical protein